MLLRVTLLRVSATYLQQACRNDALSVSSNCLAVRLPRQEQQACLEPMLPCCGPLSAVATAGGHLAQEAAWEGGFRVFG